MARSSQDVTDVGRAGGRAVVICVPVTSDGAVDHSWGRAQRVAVAEADGGRITAWTEFEVGWDRLHDSEGEGGHHARLARFLLNHRVEAVAAGHMGAPMAHMLGKMGIKVALGAAGDAREAVLEAASS